MQRTLQVLFGGASCVALAFAATTAFAAEAPTPQASSSELEELVVTAERRSEKLQDVSVAISGFAKKDLERAGVVSFEQIAPRVPSFYFGSFGALRPQLYIRGIGTRSFDPGSESSVGVFVDDVYLGRSSGSFGSLKDVERIEVLRGPQGTLYGRNTIAGAINVITVAPSPEAQVHAEVGVSTYGGYEGLIAAGGPLNTSKTLMFRLAAWRTSRDGYVTNLRTGHDFQGVDNTGGRARLAFRPNDALRIDLTAEVTHDGDESAFGGVSQGTARSVTGVPANPGAVFFASPTRLPIAVLPQSLRKATLSSDPTLDRDAQSYIGRIEYDLSVATITSITAVKKLDVSDGRDLEGSSLDVLDQSSHENSKQFTQEFRLTSNPGGALAFGGALDWILGAFYYKDNSDRADSFRVGVDSAVRAATNTAATDVALSDYRIESYAVFGQATLHVGEKLELTVGGRYTKDDKRAIQAGTTTDALPIIAVPFTTRNTATYDSFDPRVTVGYKFNPAVNVYATYSTGFKSGGFQYVPFSRAQANVLFQPEDIKTYEAGIKSEWLDRRLRVNAAAFHYDYKNLQVSRIIDAGGAPVSLITNAASSKIDGFDLEIVAKPMPQLELSATYGYLDAKYDNYVFNVAQNLDFSGTRMVRAPKHSLNLSAEYNLPLGDDRGLILRADYSYLSKFFHEPGEGDPKFGSGIPLTVEKGYGLVDLRIAYRTPDWRLTGYVTNATNEKYRRTVNALGSTIVGFAGQPRIYGLKLAYDF